MKKVIIYTTTYCPYCTKAKELLKRKNISYEEINVEGDDELRVKVSQLAGGRKTVPQIFIEDYHVGGCDDLYALEEKGELDKMV